MPTNFQALDNLIQRVINASRDTGRFKSAKIPPVVLSRLLKAAYGPLMGEGSLPLNFIVIESPEVRRQIKDTIEVRIAQKRSRQADTAVADLDDLQHLECILGASLNLAVTLPQSRNETSNLGALLQSVLFGICRAIENVWLALSAEGLGASWVSIPDKSTVERILGLPPGVGLVAYLCVGYPAEIQPGIQEVDGKAVGGFEPLIFQDQWGRPAERFNDGLHAPRYSLSPEAQVDFSARALDKMNRKTKPPGSLGMLESVAVRLAELQQSLEPSLSRKRICVYAGCHGVTAEGVSAYPGEVTEQMVLNFLSGGAAINVLARHGGIQIHVVDSGVGADWPEELLDKPNFFPRSIRRGTRNFYQESAMTAAECEQAIEIGREQVRLAVEAGIDVLGIGEMGIGNTTAASALVVALLEFDSEKAVGRGTGISDAVLERKVEVVSAAVKEHGAHAIKPYGQYWLQTVGGYEIGAMTGTILGAAKVRMPLVVDGFIATAAAAAAFDIDPACREVCFFSHRSDEQAHGDTLKALGVEPILDLKMRLGEGTGAALAMHLLEASARILCEMATFDSAGISGAIDAQG